jgi:hypothetical protein
MDKKIFTVFKFLMVAIVSISLTACGGRLPSKPAAPNPVSPAPANPDPIPNPQPTDVKPPSNTDPDPNIPNPPQPNPNPQPNPQPNPNPPDPGQPHTDTDFFILMQRFGFAKSKDELIADIKKNVNMKITDWSPGTVKNKEKNIANKFQDSAKYFNPALKDVKDYYAHSMKLAAKTDVIDFYVSVNFGPKRDSIDLIKVDAKTLEVLYYNKSGLISSYTQDNGKLLRLARFMLIPKTVYTDAARASATRFPTKW